MITNEFLPYIFILPIAALTMLLIGYWRRNSEDKSISRPYRMVSVSKLPKCVAAHAKPITVRGLVPAAKALYIGIILADTIVYLLILVLAVIILPFVTPPEKALTVTIVILALDFLIFLASCVVEFYALDVIEHYKSLVDSGKYVIFSEQALKKHARKVAAQHCTDGKNSINYRLTFLKSDCFLIVNSDGEGQASYKIAKIKKSMWVQHTIMKLVQPCTDFR